MKNILIAGLLLLSSAAFAGGKNANQPVNPPQPPTEEEVVKASMCSKFYNKTIPHYHYQDIELRSMETQTVTTIIPETAGLIGGHVVCTLILPLKLVEWFCADHGCVTSSKEHQFTRPYP